jgi:hypothetical protein
VSAPTRILVGRGVHQDPVEPAVEPLDVSQLWKLSPAANEGLLYGIVGEVGVAQNEPRDGHEPIDLAGGQLAERLPIPAPRSFNEVLPHVDRPARAGHSTGV